MQKRYIIISTIINGINHQSLVKLAKRTDKIKTWFNVKNLQDESHQSVDFSKIVGWKNIGEVLITRHSNKNIEILKVKSAKSENWKPKRIQSSWQ